MNSVEIYVNQRIKGQVSTFLLKIEQQAAVIARQATIIENQAACYYRKLSI